MAMSNLLVKTLGGPTGRISKFVLQLDAAVLTFIRQFQIIPPEQFGRSGAATGSAGVDPLRAPGYDNPIVCSSGGDGSLLITLSYTVDTLQSERDAYDQFALHVGLQGTGTLFNDMTSTESNLLWKVIAVSGQPPGNWRSMDLYQDGPAPSGNSRVV